MKFLLNIDSCLERVFHTANIFHFRPGIAFRTLKERRIRILKLRCQLIISGRIDNDDRKKEDSVEIVFLGKFEDRTSLRSKIGDFIHYTCRRSVNFRWRGNKTETIRDGFDNGEVKTPRALGNR